MKIPELKEIRPPEAWAILEADPKATLIDVRSRMEFDYVGHAPNAKHMPWAEPPDWKVIPGFVDRIRALLAKQHDGRVEELRTCGRGASSGGRPNSPSSTVDRPARTHEGRAL